MVIILSQYYPFQTDTKAQKKKKPAALERMERHGKHSKEDELEDISNPGLLKLAQT